MIIARLIFVILYIHYEQTIMNMDIVDMNHCIIRGKKMQNCRISTYTQPELFSNVILR